MVYTHQDDSEKEDANFIWTAEVYDEPVGFFISKYQAQLEIQKIFAQLEDDEINKSNRKKKKRKKKVVPPAKKSVVPKKTVPKKTVPKKKK